MGGGQKGSLTISRFHPQGSRGYPWEADCLPHEGGFSCLALPAARLSKVWDVRHATGLVVVFSHRLAGSQRTLWGVLSLVLLAAGVLYLLDSLGQTPLGLRARSRMALVRL